MKTFLRRVIVIAPAALNFGASPGLARPLEPMAEQVLAQCIWQAARGRPWLEKTLWGLRDQEAGWIGAEVPNADGSHDLGPLQVNSWWVIRIATRTGRAPGQIRWWLTHDACFNVEVARWIFLSGLAATGDYWKAVGVYHSPTGPRQRRYALSVAAKLTTRFGSDIFAAAGPRATRAQKIGPATVPDVTGSQSEIDSTQLQRESSQ